MATSMIERCPQNTGQPNVSFTIGGKPFPRKFSLQYGQSSSLYDPQSSLSLAVPGGRGRGLRGRQRTLSDDLDQPRLPLVTEHGLRLGTPVAREAAKSFWNMDMLRNRMVHFAEKIEKKSTADSDTGTESEMGSDSESSLFFCEESTPLRLPLLTTSAPSFTGSANDVQAPSFTSSANDVQAPSSTSSANDVQCTCEYDSRSPSVSSVSIQRSPSTDTQPVPFLLARRTSFNINNNGRRTSLTKLQTSRLSSSRRSLSVDGRTLTVHSRETFPFPPARKTRSWDAAYV